MSDELFLSSDLLQLHANRYSIFPNNSLNIRAPKPSALTLLWSYNCLKIESPFFQTLRLESLFTDEQRLEGMSPQVSPKVEYWWRMTKFLQKGIIDLQAAGNCRHRPLLLYLFDVFGEYPPIFVCPQTKISNVVFNKMAIVCY